jgi:hypothetical protein
VCRPNDTLARPRVVNRLVGHPAERAGELGAWIEADIEVDLLGLGIEAHVGDAPGRLQATHSQLQQTALHVACWINKNLVVEFMRAFDQKLA